MYHKCSENINGKQYVIANEGDVCNRGRTYIETQLIQTPEVRNDVRNTCCYLYGICQNK